MMPWRYRTNDIRSIIPPYKEMPSIEDFLANNKLNNDVDEEDSVLDKIIRAVAFVYDDAVVKEGTKRKRIMKKCNA